MSWGAIAKIVTPVAGAVLGGSISGSAAKDAAKTGADASDRSAAQVKAAADRARRDVQTYIPSAQKDLLAGYSGAADIFSQGVPEQQRLLQGGNMNAQQTVSGGYDQYRNALMGMPVDQSNWQPRQVAQSAPIANPFTQNMFADISQVPQQYNQNVLGGLQTNRDVLGAIESGNLGLTGVNTDWFNRLGSEAPGWMDSNTLMSQSLMSDQQVRDLHAQGGLSQGNQNQMVNLISQIRGIRG